MEGGRKARCYRRDNAPVGGTSREGKKNELLGKKNKKIKNG